MNTSTFTTAQLRLVIPRMVGEGRGVTLNDCGFDSRLIEFNPSEEIVILSADEDKDLVTVEFSQSWEGTDDGFDAWTWRYTTVQEVELLKVYLQKAVLDQSTANCKCLYEIHNNLPRTQFCMVPCSAQREARKILRNER